MPGFLDDGQSVIDQQRLPRGSMAATLGDSQTSRKIYIPHYATRSPCATARLHLAKEVGSKLPGTELDDSWLVYPSVKLGYTTSSGPARHEIAIVLPSLPKPGYFRSLKAVFDFLQQLQQQKQPLPGVKGQPAATADAETAMTAILNSLGKAFKWSSLVDAASVASPPAAASIPLAPQQTAQAPNSKSKCRKQQPQQQQQQEPSAADSSPVTAAAASSRKRGRQLKSPKQEQQDIAHEQSGASAVVVAPAGPAWPAAAAPARIKKRKLESLQLQQHQLGEELLLLNSTEDSSDSGAAAAVSSPRAPAVERCSQPMGPAAAAKRRTSNSPQEGTAAAAADAAGMVQQQQLHPRDTAAKRRKSNSPVLPVAPAGTDAAGTLQQLQPQEAAAAKRGKSKSPVLTVVAAVSDAANKEQQQLKPREAAAAANRSKSNSPVVPAAAPEADAAGKMQLQPQEAAVAKRRQTNSLQEGTETAAADAASKVQQQQLQPQDAAAAKNKKSNSPVPSMTAAPAPTAAAANNVQQQLQPQYAAVAKNKKSNPPQDGIAAAAADAASRILQQLLRSQAAAAARRKSNCPVLPVTAAADAAGKQHQKSSADDSKQQGPAAEIVQQQLQQTAAQPQQQQKPGASNSKQQQGPGACNAPQQQGPSANNSKQQQGTSVGSSSWNVPALPRGRVADPAALAVLAGHVAGALPGWQLDKFWIISPGNSSPAKPRIDPCIMHPSITHGHIRSSRAVVTYLITLSAAVAKIGKDVQVPGLVPVDTSKQQQQQQQQQSRTAAEAAAVAAAIKAATVFIGRAFVGIRLGVNDGSSSSSAAAAAAAAGVKRPRSDPEAAEFAESFAAAAADAAAAAAKRPKLGERLCDGRMPCAETLAVLQRRIINVLPGTVLDQSWVAYPGGEFSGRKLDVCVMHPSTPLGYFRSMKAVITYLTALKTAVGKTGKDLTPPGLLPTAAGQQQGKKGTSQQRSTAAAVVDPRFEDAIRSAIKATGRTFVPRTRIGPNVVSRIRVGAPETDRSLRQQQLKRLGSPRVAKTVTQQGAGLSKQQQLQGGSSSGSKKVTSLNQLSKAELAKRINGSSSSSSSKGRLCVNPSRVTAPAAKQSTKTAAALVAKAKSKALAARSSGSRSGTAAAAAAAAAPRPKFVPVTKPQKGPLVIYDKPHAQPKYHWKHPPVDREWDPPAKGAVLVLGMHFASAAAVDECHAGMAQHRDRARLLQLQQGLGYQPYSFDRDNRESQAEGGLHIQGNFNSTRGAKDVTLRFPGVKFGGIFLDYFRMPTGYALEIYKQQLFTQFVPELVRLGAAEKGVPVVVPNNEVLLSKLAKEGAFQGYTDFVAMPGECYPLYQATELSTAKGLLQGAYCNDSEVRSLCEGSEFVVMHCNMTAPLNGN